MRLITIPTTRDGLLLMLVFLVPERWSVCVLDGEMGSQSMQVGLVYVH